MTWLPANLHNIHYRALAFERLNPSYQDQQARLALSPEEQFAVSHIVELAFQNSDVLHVGAFGSTAVTMNNVFSLRRRRNHFADLDLLLVVERGVDKLKDQLRSVFQPHNATVEIVFGDDEDYFYHFRTEKKTLIEIELFERESGFYRNYRLLGYSIPAHYLTLYASSEKPLDELIGIPREPIDLKERTQLFISDRKGLEQFVTRLSETHDNKIDLRRVLTINAQNMYWALTGDRVVNMDALLDFLRSRNLLDRLTCDRIQQILPMQSEHIRSHYAQVKSSTLEVLGEIRKAIDSRI